MCIKHRYTYRCGCSAGPDQHGSDISWLRPCHIALETVILQSCNHRLVVCDDIHTEKYPIPGTCPKCNLNPENFLTPEYQQYMLENQHRRRQLERVRCHLVSRRRAYDANNGDDDGRQSCSEAETTRDGHRSDVEAETEARKASVPSVVVEGVF